MLSCCYNKGLQTWCLNNAIISSYSSGAQKFNMDLSELTSRCQQDCVPFWRFWEASFPCLFQLPNGAPILWLLGPFLKVSDIASLQLLLHHHKSV